MTQQTNRRTFIKQTAGAMSLLGAAQILTHAHAAEPAAPKKLGFAFVGLGRFATRQLMPGTTASKFARVAALVTGSPEKAKKFGEQYGVDAKSIYTYENFDQIKDNPDVDVVYVVLPNSMHAEFTIRAAEAGKHVLCEKPMAITGEECQQMIDACKKHNRKLMIGYRLRYEPYNMKAIEICQQKTYGPVRLFEGNHSFPIGQGEWRTQKKLSGGGPVMDVGIYCLNAARYLTGEEPTHVTAQTWQPKDDPRFVDTDAQMVFSLKFPSGALANCSTSYVHHTASRAIMHTDKAIVTLEPAYGYGGQRIKISGPKGEQNVDLPHINQFAAEMDHFAECIMQDKTPLTPGEDGMADVKIMQKLYESAEGGKTVAV